MNFGPDTFEASARLRFIPDPLPGQHEEADVDLPVDHPSDFAQARRALHLLGGFTSTPEDCWFRLWKGYSTVPLPPDVRRGPLVEIPHLRFALLRWCFASDVDPHWAGLGAQREAVDVLLRDPELDVVPARPAELQPLYR